ncbi:enhanced intracellular survival protein Eis [Fictibacillus aquaticus]|nr:GNAT family N-acetyltransferase [Fictibacillus aquaticus]
MLEFKVMKSDEVETWLDLLDKAYPGFKAPREKMVSFLTDIIEKEKTQDLYGLYDNGTLVGGVRLLQFQMNCGGAIVPAGGIGLVAIDLLRRREGLAKVLLKKSIDYFNERGVHIAALYPFETSFYKKAGFGHGVQISQYKIKPGSFSNKGNKENLKEWRGSVENRRKLLQCYNAVLEKTNGMTERIDRNLDSVFKDGQHTIVYENENGTVEGYLTFSYRNEATFINSMDVKEMIYLTPQALNAFCSFFYSQKDQLERIIISSNDEYFRYLADDARNGDVAAFDSIYLETHVTADGLMYRVLDTKRFLHQLSSRNFGGLNGQLKLSINDSFLDENNGPVYASFTEGQIEVIEEGDARVELNMDISDFSSLIMGAVDMKGLLRLGLAEISDEAAADTVGRLFALDSKPVSMISY